MELDPPDLQVQAERMELQEVLAQLVPLVPQVYKVFPVLQAPEVSLDPRVNLDPEVPQQPLSFLLLLLFNLVLPLNNPTSLA